MPNFHGVIPGGESFSIPLGTITNTTDMGTGFQWVPTVRTGSTLMVVSGDDRGLGTGGSDLFSVSAGLNPNSSCISNTSPSSTAGPPAGGSYPTNASGGWTTGSSRSVSNSLPFAKVASLTRLGLALPTQAPSSVRNPPLLPYLPHSPSSGGVIGGLAAIVVLALVAFYIIRRKTAPKSQKERPVNLIQGDPEDNDDASANYQPPAYLQPDPYLVTAPTLSSVSAREDGHRYSSVLSDSPSSAWRQSRVTSYSDPSSATPDLEGHVLTPGSTTALTSSRKSGMSRQLRAVNIIQHEDAGPSSAQDDSAQPETIELPPAYTHIRKAEP